MIENSLTVFESLCAFFVPLVKNNYTKRHKEYTKNTKDKTISLKEILFFIDINPLQVHRFYSAP